MSWTLDEGTKNKVKKITMRFYCYSFLPMVLEAVLEAVRQKMNAVLYLNRSPLNIGYGFYFYDSFNAPVFSRRKLIN